ncbi:hypothetical protein ACEPAF_5644 [Sanghuangporus sanghuang]
MPSPSPVMCRPFKKGQPASMNRSTAFSSKPLSAAFSCVNMCIVAFSDECLTLTAAKKYTNSNEL